MSYIYLFEAYVNRITFPNSLKIQDESIEVQVLLPGLLSFVIDIADPQTADNINIHCEKTSFSGGKAVVFVTNPEALKTGLEENSINILVSNEEYGSAQAKTDPEWLRKVQKIGIKDPCIQRTDKSDIRNSNDKKVGTLDLNVTLYCYGESIEVPLRTGGPSSLNIPINLGAGRISTAWQPLFGAKVKHTPSKMDSSMLIYAQLAGLDPDTTGAVNRLTAEFVNKRLCGHKTCPGAVLFKHLGIGPLAAPGAGLGSIKAIKDAKPCGLYGMSQAYGTLDQYGAYGLFVKKKKQTTCNSPDCPWTQFYEPSEKESEPDCCTGYKNQLNKCICKCCGKKVKKYPSTCGDLFCPSMQKTKSLQCKGPICPITAIKPEILNNYCNSPDCPFEPEETDPTCKGEKCPYSEQNIDKCCINPKCSAGKPPFPRQSAGADKENYKCSFLKELINSSYKYNAPNSNLPNSCNDPNCAWRKSHNAEKHKFNTPTSVGSAESDWGKPAHKDEENKEADEKEEFLITKMEKNNCGDQECDVNNADTENRTLYKVEDNNIGGQPKLQKNVTLVVNDKGEKILVSDTRENMNFDKEALKHDFISLLSGTDDLEIYYMIASLLAKSKDSQGKLKGVKSNDFACKTAMEKPKKTRPCKKASCTSTKYKTCSECGGVSRSGATCDNTDVSFSNVSYNEYPASLAAPAQPKKTTQIISKAIPPISDRTKNEKPESTSASSKVVVMKKKRKRRSRFVYKCGDDYPGIRLGHRNCNLMDKPIPASMGWLWTAKPEGVGKRRKGWRPGMVTKIIQDRIHAFREKRGIPEPPALKMLVPKKKNLRVYLTEEDEAYEAPEQKPTLVIAKKDGNYLITLNPLKDPKTVDDNEDPYMKCKPMQFVIVKPTKPLRPTVEQSQLQNRDEIECMGEDEESFYDNFYKTCYCDENGEIIESSSDSELNIEFTTPAGIINPEKMKQMPNVVHADTQFKEEDFTCSYCPTIVSKYGKKPKAKKVKMKHK